MGKGLLYSSLLALTVILIACGGSPAAPASSEQEAGSESKPSVAESQGASATAVGSFDAAGRMADGRAEHVAALLPDGRVLVAGGRGAGAGGGFASGSIKLDTAEIYDPASEKWGRTAAMNHAKGREKFSAVSLKDGRVLITGGEDTRRESLNKIEIWDPATGLWTQGAKMTKKRFDHASALLADGRALVVGGANALRAPLVEAEFYDAAADAWSPAGEMSQSRTVHTVTLLQDGRVLVVGGSRGGIGLEIAPYDSAEVFDPATGTWTSAGATSVGHSQHTATLLQDGRVLIAAGIGKVDTAEIYDPATDSWTVTEPMTKTRADHAASLLPDGRVLVTGGIGKFTSTEVFDPATGTWSAGPPMRDARYQHTSTVLSDGRVLLTGGNSEDESGDRAVTVTAEVYTP